MLVHGSCVGIGGRGVLLRGPPGGGKSDLALRLIADGAVLVADDQVMLVGEAGRLRASAPAAIAGRIEVRAIAKAKQTGIGIVTMEYAESVALLLVVDLVAPEQVERMPEALHCDYLGLGLARVALAPFEASAPAKVRLAVDAAARDSTRRS